MWFSNGIDERVCTEENAHILCMSTLYIESAQKSLTHKPRYYALNDKFQNLVHILAYFISVFVWKCRDPFRQLFCIHLIVIILPYSIVWVCDCVCVTSFHQLLVKSINKIRYNCCRYYSLEFWILVFASILTLSLWLSVCMLPRVVWF